MHIIKVMMTHSSICARMCIPVLLSNSGQWGWYTFTNNGVLKQSCSFESTREVSAHVSVEYITQQCFYGLDHGPTQKHIFTHPHCLNGGYLILLFNQLHHLKNVKASSLVYDVASLKFKFA